MSTLTREFTSSLTNQRRTALILKRALFPKVHLLNNEGSISLVIMPFFLITCAMVMMNLAKSIQEYKVLKFRAQSYLCMKKVINLNNSYIEFLAKTNAAIKASYYAKKIPFPKTKAAATAAHRALRLTQQAYHVKYLVNLKKKTNCSTKSLVSSFKTMPVKTKALRIRRDRKGQAIIRKKWKNTFVFIPSGGIYMKLHSFKNTISFKTRKRGLVSKSLKMTSKELSL